MTDCTKIRIFIAGREVLASDVSPSRVFDVLNMAIAKLPELAERGRTAITIDSMDHPNVTYLCATRKAFT